jgi:hypothetical protein
LKYRKKNFFHRLAVFNPLPVWRAIQRVLIFLIFFLEWQSLAVEGFIKKEIIFKAFSLSYGTLSYCSFSFHSGKKTSLHTYMSGLPMYMNSSMNRRLRVYTWHLCCQRSSKTFLGLKTSLMISTICKTGNFTSNPSFRYVHKIGWRSA